LIHLDRLLDSFCGALLEGGFPKFREAKRV
jgi:hypothetical protein